MNSNNNVNHYVVLTIFLLVFCMATVYYKPATTNIELHINRLTPRRLDATELRKRRKALSSTAKQDDNPFLKYLKNLKLSYTSSSSMDFVVKDASFLKSSLDESANISPQIFESDTTYEENM